MVQWYPGHMAKAKKEIEEKLKVVDIVFELIDARIPLSSRNPMINDILKNKPRLVILTKSDMADNNYTKKWQQYFKNEGINSLVIDSLKGFNVNRIIPLSREVLKDKFEKERLKGLKTRPIRGMIVGIPNVGKSTLINKLVNRKVATVANYPGVTKAQQWVRLNDNLDLLDTPGVLWPKFEDPKVGINLALTGAVKDEILRSSDLAEYLVDFLKQYYPNKLHEKYNVDESKNNIEILVDIARLKGISEKEDILEKSSEALIFDFRNLRIGKFTLDII